MIKYVKVFLRLSIAISFISAVADRFGYWPAEQSTWSNWESFVAYTQVLNPWASESATNFLAVFATVAELVLGFLLIIGLKTKLAAKLSGILLLIFGLSMLIHTGVKPPLDYSVFTACAAAFALSFIKEQYLEVDLLLKK